MECLSPFQQKKSKTLANDINDTVALGITQNLTKSVLPADKKGIFKFLTKYKKLKRQGLGTGIRTEIRKFQTKLRKFQYVGG